MSASIRAAAGLSAWRIAVIGVVAICSVGIGVALGGFLLQTRTAALGAAATYVPADAPFYVELRIEPSSEQDAALRELLGRFPAIEGVNLERSLHDQLVELIDEQLEAQDEVDLSWADDVAPWFDGRIGFGITDLPVDVLTESMDSMDEPPLPGMIVVVGVTDATAARSTIERVSADQPGMESTQTQHRGVTVHALATGEGAYAVTNDSLLVAPTADDVTAALDIAADPERRLSDNATVVDMAAQLPEDWLAFATYDLTDLMAQAFSQARTAEPEMAAALESLMEHQSLRGAVAVSAAGDRFILDAAFDAPTGPFARVNEDRSLADEVPSDTLYFSDAGNVGAALAGVIGPLKEAAAATPEAAEQLRIAEAALGGDFEELVSWIDDAAIAVGYDGDQPYGGLVLVPNDVDAAQRRMDQLGSFAALAALDPSSGISVDEREVAGVAVTTIHWDAPDDATAFMQPVPGGVSLEYAVTDDRALIGIGETFVERVLGLDASDALAAEPRYADAVASLGGAANAGVTWVDLAGSLTAVEDALGSTLGSAEGGDVYESEVRLWLLPLDRIVSVSRLEGDVLVQRAILLVE